MLNSLIHKAAPYGVKNVSRRAFVKGVAAALVGGVLLAIESRAPGALWVPEPLPSVLQRSTFARYLGETFQIALESSGSVVVRLIQVGDLPSKAYKLARGNPSMDQQQSFSIVFRGPGNQALEQGTYRFEHGQIGGFPLFIVPMLPDREAQYYEAIFNRQQS